MTRYGGSRASGYPPDLHAFSTVWGRPTASAVEAWAHSPAALPSGSMGRAASRASRADAAEEGDGTCIAKSPCDRKQRPTRATLQLSAPAPEILEGAEHEVGDIGFAPNPSQCLLK